MPIKFWGECILTAAHIINRTPTIANGGLTPYEMLFDQKPSYNHIRTFGCLCYVQTHHKKRDKFDERAAKCIFIGYPHGQKGWRVYDLRTKKILVSRDVVFYEDMFPYMDTMQDSVSAARMPTFPEVAMPTEALEKDSQTHIAGLDASMTAAVSNQHEEIIQGQNDIDSVLS